MALGVPNKLTTCGLQDLKVYDYGWSSGFCFTCQGTHGIVIWESEDLITWTGPTYPTVSPENAGMTWAPDTIWHPEKEAYQVFWTSKLDGGDALHIMRSFTTDFKNFTVGERYVDRGMDATIAYADDTGKYYFISKNGPADGIEHSTSDSLEGSWTKLGDRIGLNKMQAGEGPLIFRNNLNPDKVRNHHVSFQPSNSGIGRFVIYIALLQLIV